MAALSKQQLIKRINGILAFQIHDTSYEALKGQDKRSVDQAAKALATAWLEDSEKQESKYFNVIFTMERAVDHGNGLDVYQVEDLLGTLRTTKKIKAL